MAMAKVREELCCSLCLEIFSDPVCLSCGHHFCKNCIEKVFERQRFSKVYSCPECRTIFKKRPAPARSWKLCNIVEHLFSDKAKQDGGILCTYCIGFNMHAIKKCLLCEAFLCEEHLKVHSKSQGHILIELNVNVQMDSERKCLTHNELLTCYCFQDDVLLCALCCSLGTHSTHKTDILSNAYTEKIEKLKTFLDKILVKRRAAGKKIRGLKDQVHQLQEKATGIKVNISNVFKDIRKLINEFENQVNGELNRQKHDIFQQLSERIQQLELHKDELYQKVLHIEELFGVNDPVIFLTESKSILCNYSKYEKNIKMEHSGMWSVTHKLDEVLISVTLESSLINLANSIGKLNATRLHIDEQSAIVMNPNTANNKVTLSSDLKTASYLKSEIKAPIVPESFSSSQVLSTVGFNSGEHYLEIQVSPTGYWTIGMAYPTIEKTGNKSLIGCNDKSWGLTMLNNQVSALHNAESKSVQVGGSLKGIGIYLNYEAGVLSFYQISSTIRHLHTFSVNFLEPLYPAFYICGNGWVKIKN